MAIATSTAILIAAGAAAAGTAASGIAQAEAQGDIAEAQMAAASEQQRSALRFAAPTSQELENLQKQVELYSRSYSQQTAMIDQLEKQIIETYGPAIMEQGKQYYNQLRGESSGVVKSFDNQRNRQRQQLRAQLIERMGPDALTSSAGVNALNDFDQKTSDMRATIEEQSMNNAIQRLGTLQQTQGAAGYTAVQAYQGMSGLLQSIQKGYGDIQSRQAYASMQTAPAVIGTAGSENVAALGRAQAFGKAFEQLGKIAGYGLGASGGGPAPTATDTFFTEPSFGESSFSRPTFSDRFSLGVEGVSPGATPSSFDSGNFGDFTFNR